MKLLNHTYIIVCVFILGLSTVVTSCKKSEDSDAPKSGSLKVSVNATAPPEDDYHICVLSGSLTVHLNDTQSNILSTQYIQGSAGNVTFENLVKGTYYIRATAPFKRIRKSNGTVTNSSLSELVLVSFDGSGKQISISLN